MQEIAAGDPAFEQMLAELATLLQQAPQQQQAPQPNPQTQAALENSRRQPYLYKEPMTEDDYARRDQQINSPAPRNAILDAAPNALNKVRDRMQMTAPLMGPMALPIMAGSEVATNALAGLARWGNATDQAVKGVPPDPRTGLPAEIQPSDILSVPGVGMGVSTLSGGIPKNALAQSGGPPTFLEEMVEKIGPRISGLGQKIMSQVKPATAAEKSMQRSQAAIDKSVADKAAMDKKIEAEVLKGRTVENGYHPNASIESGWQRRGADGRWMSQKDMLALERQEALARLSAAQQRNAPLNALARYGVPAASALGGAYALNRMTAQPESQSDRSLPAPKNDGRNKASHGDGQGKIDIPSLIWSPYR